MKWTDESDRDPETPDLDAWRAEAGACAPLDAAATRGPWRECLAEQGGCQCCTIWSTPDDIPVADTKTAIAYEGKVAPESAMRADARFIAAARTGWPRDAARVGVLCERVALLERLLAQALDGWYAAHFPGSPRRADAETIARLRALAAGGAPAKEPTP